MHRLEALPPPTASSPLLLLGLRFGGISSGDDDQLVDDQLAQPALVGGGVAGADGPGLEVAERALSDVGVAPDGDLALQLAHPHVAGVWWVELEVRQLATGYVELAWNLYLYRQSHFTNIDHLPSTAETG